jgi:dimethylhistidine N-methyltransferase
MTQEQGDISAGERAKIIDGLLAAQAQVAPKYFYDLAGSRLFEVITLLDEYYPTVTERAILQRHAGDIAATFTAAAGRCALLAEPGAGSCEKVRFLLPVLKPAQYLALDVSVDFVELALQSLRRDFPQVRMTAAPADIAQVAQPWPLPDDEGSRLFFYPGSSIGNFTPDEALALIARIHAQCRGQGGLLIGVDLVKDTAVLHAAYNDALGVTAAFNLNLLRHLNRLIGSDFRPQQWEHRAFYDEANARIEMHLRARETVTVRWPGEDGEAGERVFAAGETLHTENSYKYTSEAFEALLRHAGFTQVHRWTDARDYFGVFLALA